eukprot:gene849-840_t
MFREESKYHYSSPGVSPEPTDQSATLRKPQQMSVSNFSLRPRPMSASPGRPRANADAPISPKNQQQLPRIKTERAVIPARPSTATGVRTEFRMAQEKKTEDDKKPKEVVFGDQPKPEDSTPESPKPIPSRRPSSMKLVGVPAIHGSPVLPPMQHPRYRTQGEAMRGWRNWPTERGGSPKAGSRKQLDAGARSRSPSPERIDFDGGKVKTKRRTISKAEARFSIPGASPDQPPAFDPALLIETSYAAALEEAGGLSQVAKFKSLSKQMEKMVDRHVEAHQVSPVQNNVFMLLNMEALYKEADNIMKVFDEFGKSIVDMLGGPQNVTWSKSFKSRERATDKVTYRYGGDICKLTDIVRGTLVIHPVGDDKSEIECMYEGLKKVLLDEDSPWSKGTPYFNWVEFNDRFQRADTPEAYRDIQMLVSFFGHIAELQINCYSIYDTKKHGGHKRYRVARETNERILSLAVQDSADILLALREPLADPNATTDLTSKRALFFAAVRTNKTHVSALLSKGADVFAFDSSARVPVIYALHAELIEYIGKTEGLDKVKELIKGDESKFDLATKLKTRQSIGGLIDFPGMDSGDSFQSADVGMVASARASVGAFSKRVQALGKQVVSGFASQASKADPSNIIIEEDEDIEDSQPGLNKYSNMLDDMDSKESGESGEKQIIDLRT